MAGKSKKTTVVSVRLYNEDVAIIDKRSEKYPGTMTRGTYIRMRMEYDLHRKHAKSRKPKKV